MRPSFLWYRITRASAPLRRLTGLIKQLRSGWRWGWLILGIVIIPAISVPIFTLAKTDYATSSNSLCLSCHGTGEEAYTSEEKIVTKEDRPIMPPHEMRDKHKELLNEWKKSVVRQGDRTYVSSEGHEYNMSLTSTCADCHLNKTEFCDQCHSYVAVKPKCWECHNIPEDGISKDD